MMNWHQFIGHRSPQQFLKHTKFSCFERAESPGRQIPSSFWILSCHSGHAAPSFAPQKRGAIDFAFILRPAFAGFEFGTQLF